MIGHKISSLIDYRYKHIIIVLYGKGPQSQKISEKYLWSTALV